MLNRTFARSARRLIPALAVAALCASSCARTNPQSLLVRGNGFVSSKGGCNFLGNINEAGPFRGRGVFDLALSDTYWLVPVVSNMMPPIQSAGTAALSADKFHLEDHNITLTGAILNYEASDISVQGAGVPGDLFVHSTMVVSPERTAMMPIEAIPGSVGSRLLEFTRLQERGQAAEFLVKIIFEAHTQGGHVFHSNEFVYPVTVCNGCLPYNPPGTSCTSLDPEPDNLPCLIGQDEKLDCRVCMLVYGDRMLCDWNFRSCVASQTLETGTEDAAKAACRSMLGIIDYVTPPQ
jgi:hypothetical protein